MFYLERQNRKNEKMKSEGQTNQKKQIYNFQISDSMFSRGKTYVFPLETKSKILKNNKKRLKGKSETNLKFF